ncbi:hypothetical protein [Cytobacillus dafuensis]|uniref:hypothetical protein n=1 Tax=Cytobacillus dafuensis TaxID=1742359 RepID=UPI0012E3D0F3|nr:hypothetical protein [Cytobacillus dafuensis]
MREHKNVQDEVVKRLGDTYHNEDFIFAKMERQYGNPIVIKTVQNRMVRLLKIADLKS